MTAETLLQEFEVMTDAPNGVQKLRELILQLAVRGKLVPQDPSDEPGAALLERIAAEKERLFEEGKIGKPKPLLPISEGETRFELPGGWEWTRLDTLGTVNPRNDLPDAVTVAFCPMSSLPEDYGGATNHEERPWREIKKGYTHFAEEDVVVAKITPCFQNGKAAVMRNLRGGAGAGTTELHVFRPVNGTVVPDYVLIFLKSPGFVSGGVQTMTGTAGQQRVSRTYFAQSPFPLPPFAEQHRIAAKVGELMALCDTLEVRQQRRAEARVRLNRSALYRLTTASDGAELADHCQRLRENFHLLYDTPETVAELRQAVLQLAVRGKLVPQDPSDEPASILLGRIAEEKWQLFRKSKSDEHKALPPITEDDLPFAIPSSWKWVRFGDAVINRDSERVPVSSEIRAGRQGPYPYYGASGIIDYVDNYLFDKALLLIGEDGANLLLRSTPIAFLAEGKYWVNNHAHVVDGITPHLLRYIAICLNATNLAPYVTGTAQPKLNQARLNSISIALPPLREQQRIVAKVNELMALCDTLEVRLTRACEKSTHLAASVVHHLTAA